MGAAANKMPSTVISRRRTNTPPPYSLLNEEWPLQMMLRLLSNAAVGPNCAHLQRLHTTAGVSNAWRACLGKIDRDKFLKQYRVTLMRPDGSTVVARCNEPLQMVQLPLDVNTLSEDEKRIRLAARKPKTVRVQEESIDDNFDVEEYTKLWKGTA